MWEVEQLHFDHNGDVELVVLLGGVVRKQKDCILIRSTGLHDREGKEIWEGDVLSCGDDSGIVVVWDERTAGFGLDKIGWAFRHFFAEALDSRDSAVIGNIHSHPHLLPVK